MKKKNAQAFKVQSTSTEPPRPSSQKLEPQGQTSAHIISDTESVFRNLVH